MANRKTGRLKRLASRLSFGDTIYYGLVTCTVSTSAAFPFYIHFHQDEFGPPLMHFYGAEEQNPVPDVTSPAYQRLVTALIKPRLELDKITTSSITVGKFEQQIRAETEKVEQPFPGEDSVASEKLTIIFVSSGRILATDNGRVLSLKIGSAMPDGSRIKSIRQTGGGWEVLTSTGTILMWTGRGQ